jgi:predicted alpha/beta superfamily hydrolase
MKNSIAFLLMILIAFTVSSAQSNVILPEQSFKMSGLDRDRHIRIYLPKNYLESEKNYPVLYMHDGQNLFDDSTSFAGEWGIDESLDQLALSTGFELIVVGIDNGQEKRYSELSPWQNRAFGNAEGEKYMEFIVKQIKPYIDSTYRTIPNRENTAIMGSSMGGLISHYAIYKYPEVFGKAGIFSASYWYADKVYDYTLENPIPGDARIYTVIGINEAEMVYASKTMYDYILQTGHPKENVNFVIDQNGDHNEASWGKQFIPAIKWLFDL